MALSLFRLPKLGKKDNRWTTFIDGNGNANKRAIAMTTLSSDEIFFVLDDMTALAVEAYTFVTGTNPNEVTRTMYQLVAYGAGPGWGPDLTRLADVHQFTSTLPQDALNAGVIAALNRKDNVTIAINNILGATEGKYILLAGFSEAEPLQIRLNNIFDELDGGRSNASTDNVRNVASYGS